MMDGMRKQDPPTIKKLPVEADVPEFLAEAGGRSLIGASSRIIVFFGLESIPGRRREMKTNKKTIQAV